MRKKRLIVLITVVVIILVLLGFNGRFGNPLSRHLVEKAAAEYLSENFSDLDVYIEDVTYDAKTGNYHANVKSPSSVDTHFTIAVSMTGHVSHDTYHNVLYGYNTFTRIDEAYSAMVKPVLTNTELPYTLRWCLGGLEITYRQNSTGYARAHLIMEDLELDKDYDVAELGRQAGYLSVYVYDETVTSERAAEILMDIKARFDAAQVPFYAVSLTLCAAEGSDDVVHITDFPYAQISENGLSDKIRNYTE